MDKVDGVSVITKSAGDFESLLLSEITARKIETAKTDTEDTVSLIEAWVHWALNGKLRTKESSKVRSSQVYFMDKIRGKSICAVSGYTTEDILRCNRAWGELPWLYNRFIQYYYVGNASKRTVCYLCRIRQHEFDRVHQSALRALSEKFYKLQKLNRLEK